METIQRERTIRETFLLLPIPRMFLRVGAWLRRHWQAVVILLLAIGLVIAILVPVHCGREVVPIPAPTTPTIEEPVEPVSITNEEFREFLRIVFPGFSRKIDRHFYFPVKLAEVPLLLRDQREKLEIGYYEKEDQNQIEEIVLVYNQGKIMIYKIKPFERISLVEGTGKLVFP